MIANRMRGVRIGAAFLAAAALLWPGAARAEPKSAGAVTRLFDGRSLDGWNVTDFAGHGQVEVEDGRLVLRFGESLTGVTYADDLPSDHFEVRLEAMRVDGADFFCGLTFRVGNAPCSLIVGGWGGGVVGLSSIDGFDASENETTSYAEFAENRWYKIRLRVDSERIGAWIDEKQVVDVPRQNRKFTVRPEVELSRPFGFASWQTTAALRNIVLETLDQPPGQAPRDLDLPPDEATDPAVASPSDLDVPPEVVGETNSANGEPHCESVSRAPRQWKVRRRCFRRRGR